MITFNKLCFFKRPNLIAPLCSVKEKKKKEKFPKKCYQISNCVRNKNE